MILVPRLSMAVWTTHGILAETVCMGDTVSDHPLYFFFSYTRSIFAVPTLMIFGHPSLSFSSTVHSKQ